ncbi:9023_t:CDS:1 [Funneliformis geosporum]|uniref:16267_t:CDS:1 n=1 Tax=Funneliformis geosporum TaxID=1117311 RepID=A0A9W4SN01_9GLOM|nr:9023_t:CDS:1 [Funneliformis geosporum]CAI2174191.1 16267_t:CDS:1 [Funneliformis geosporum]
MSQVNNKPIRRQPRGSINRRACQKCRQLKIKCDGDAEKNFECSNCDTGTCVYDKSPRKNRQVEKLNNRVESLEKNLVETDIKLQTRIRILNLEKQIQSLIIDCLTLLPNTRNDQTVLTVFSQLRQAINESRCWEILMPIIIEFLSRLLQNDHDNETYIHIIEMLKNIAENTMNYCNPNDAFNRIATQQNIDEIVAQYTFSNDQQTQPLNTMTTATTESISTPSIIRTSPIMNEIANLSLSPGSDADSDLSTLGHLTRHLELASPLTPEQIEQFSHNGSEYGTSPVNNSINYATIDFPQQQYFNEFPFETFYDSFGSNSSH